MSIPIYIPDLSGNEVAYAEAALRSGWISSIGEFVDRFETALAKETECAHAIAVANGTVALHLACRVVQFVAKAHGIFDCRRRANLELHRVSAQIGLWIWKLG